MRLYFPALILCCLIVANKADEQGSAGQAEFGPNVDQFDNNENGENGIGQLYTTTQRASVRFEPKTESSVYLDQRYQPNLAQSVPFSYPPAQPYYPEPEQGQPQFRPAQPSNGRQEQHLSNVNDRQPDHAPRITQTYGRYASSASVIWYCDGMDYQNFCHLKNRYNFVKFAFAERFQADSRLLLLDVADAARKRHTLPRRPNPVYSYNAARLDTNYLPARYVDACLYLSYGWSGVGEKKLVVVQRNEDDVCVYFDERNQQSSTGSLGVPEPSPDGYDPRFEQTRYPDPSLEWKNVEIPLDLRYGSPKFWIEFVFDLGLKERGEQVWRQLGHIALRNFTIANGRCMNPVEASRQNCDDPLAQL